MLKLAPPFWLELAPGANSSFYSIFNGVGMNIFWNHTF